MNFIKKFFYKLFFYNSNKINSEINFDEYLNESLFTNKINNINYNNEFINAVLNNDHDYLMKLIYLIDKENINIYYYDENQTSLLMILAQNKNYRILENLLNFYDINKIFEVDKLGNNILFYIIKNVSLNNNKKNELYYMLDLFFTQILLNIKELDYQKYYEYLNHKNNEGLNIIYFIVKYNLKPEFYLNLIENFELYIDFQIVDDSYVSILNNLLEYNCLDISKKIIYQKKGVINKSLDGLENLKILLKRYNFTNSDFLINYIKNYKFTIDDLFDKSNENSLKINDFLNKDYEKLINYFINMENSKKYFNLEFMMPIYYFSTYNINSFIEKNNLDVLYKSFLNHNPLNILTFSILYFSKKTSFKILDLYYKNAKSSFLEKYNYLIYSTIFYCILTKNEELALKYIEYIQKQKKSKYLLFFGYKDVANNNLLILSCKNNMEQLAIKILNLSPDLIYEKFEKIIYEKNIEESKKNKKTNNKIIKKDYYDTLKICCEKNLVEVVILIIEKYNYNYFIKNSNNIIKYVNYMAKKNIDITKPFLSSKIYKNINIPNELNILMFEYIYVL